jgi:hypothetical protein
MTGVVSEGSWSGRLRPGLDRPLRYAEIAVWDEEARGERIPLEAGGDLEHAPPRPHEHPLHGDELHVPEHELAVPDLAIAHEGDAEGLELNSGLLFAAAREGDAGGVEDSNHVGHEGCWSGEAAPFEHEDTQGVSWSDAVCLTPRDEKIYQKKSLV